jgi:NADH oxidase (H2O2-forming)
MARTVVIIGSGAAGMTAASTARATAKDAEIHVFTEDKHIAYSPCAIPFVIEGKIPDFNS